MPANTRNRCKLLSDGIFYIKTQRNMLTDTVTLRPLSREIAVFVKNIHTSAVFLFIKTHTRKTHGFLVRTGFTSDPPI
jgi:hypothetical protein